MNRITRLAFLAIGSATALASCLDRHAALPPSPTTVQPSGGAFTVSGIVREYHGGPIANATVKAIPVSSSAVAIRTTTSGPDGFYRFDSLTEPSGIEATKDGYDSGTPPSQYTRDATADLTLRRRLSIAAGDKLTATLWYDDSIDIEGVASCHYPPNACAVVHVTASMDGQLICELRWAGGGRQLSLRALTDFDVRTWSFNGPTVQGASPLQLTARVYPGDTTLAVGFAGTPPIGSGQDFELTTTIK